MPTSDELLQRGKKIEAELFTIQEKISQGDRIDLTTVESRIRGLCAAIAVLPSAEAREFGTLLENMILLLNRLEVTVKGELSKNREKLARFQD